jgi:hypothetical protein
MFQFQRHVSQEQFPARIGTLAALTTYWESVKNKIKI